jgi:hypothetical protein
VDAINGDSHQRRRRQDSVDAINYILCGEMSRVTDDAVKGSMRGVAPPSPRILERFKPTPIEW